MTELQEKISKLPLSPGCYLFKDESGKIIYVGKAKELRKRVSSYFTKNDHDEKTKLLISKIADFDFVLTQSEVEALILENNLIKKHYPRYNIDLKDSRRYAYLKLNSGDYPWLETVRKREGEGEYYGPFVSGQMRKDIVVVLRRHFGIFMKKPLVKIKKTIDKEEYNNRVKQARKILSGHVDELIKDLNKEMEISSQRKFYEHAMSRRNQIEALKSLEERQIMELKRQVDAHIINFIIADNVYYLLVFNMRKGILESKQKFVFDQREDSLEEFLVQFYSSTIIPEEIILPIEISESMKEYLELTRGGKVKVIIPEKGERKKLLDLVLKNVEATFFSGQESVIDLGKGLGLSKIPRHIECFDISHLGGTNTVASMVTFIDGKAEKSLYRKFKINSVSGPDDFLSMEEVIDRRYSKSLSQKMKLPDLIVIDGGKGQLSSAKGVLDNLGVKIEIISLAKRIEEVFLPGEKDSIILDRKSKGLLLLRAIRDEAHRFAISYQRKLRSKGLRE